MNFTREDAKRLINDLPKVYKEMSEQEFFRWYGRKPQKYEAVPIVVADVKIAYVKKKGVHEPVPEFVLITDENIHTVLVDQVSTKKLIEDYYEKLKWRQKGAALESLYTYANQELKWRSEVDVSKLVGSILELHANFDKAIEMLAPIDITNTPKTKYTQIQRTVERISNRTLTVEFFVSEGGFDSARVIPHLSAKPGVSGLFKMIQDQDYRVLANTFYGTLTDTTFKAIYSDNTGVINKYLSKLDAFGLADAKRIVDFSNDLLKNTYEKYNVTVGESYNVIAKLSSDLTT